MRLHAQTTAGIGGADAASSSNAPVAGGGGGGGGGAAGGEKKADVLAMDDADEAGERGADAEELMAEAEITDINSYDDDAHKAAVKMQQAGRGMLARKHQKRWVVVMLWWVCGRDVVVQATEAVCGRDVVVGGSSLGGSGVEFGGGGRSVWSVCGPL